MNTHRTAYAGRNFEYYSEDPLLSGKIGSSTLKGAQSKDLITYIKHFALNDGEGVIDATNNVKESKDGLITFSNERAIREIYLPAFKEAVEEGGANGVMNARLTVLAPPGAGTIATSNKMFSVENGDSKDALLPIMLAFLITRPLRRVSKWVLISG